METVCKRKELSVSPAQRECSQSGDCADYGKGISVLEKIHTLGWRNRNAFTVMEVIAVLILIGILTGIAAVTLLSTDTYTTKSQLAMVEAHLRYAQARAIHSDSSWGINFAGTRSYDGRTYSNYWLFTGGDDATPVKFQVEIDSRYVVVFSDGSVGTWPLAISTVATVEFDEWGSPGSTSVTISTDAGNIVVTKNTGYID
ncbi:MAG: prepilin-type N-terminal cleavage/methylation domain-containing protein [Syntrophobacterales bacterium]|nr:MAG: prepilin-type N-terminal cleavage/methylation domain-containing protein [Syntrophobacterales bacterium]